MISGKNASIALCFMLSGVTAIAQDTVSNHLDEVIVLADKIQIPFKKQNRNIQILHQDAIKQLPVKSVNELLSYMAGLDVRQRGVNGAQADISIDGGTFDQTLVLINGVKMSDPQTGHNMMNLPIPLDAIERIEVLKGAAARIYGVNALMGVINIVTKSPKSNEIIARTYAGSSFQQDDSTRSTYMNYGLQAAATLSTASTQQLIAAGYDKSTGYRYNTANEIKKIWYQGTWNAGRGNTIEWMGGAMTNHFGANLFYAAPNDKEATEQVDVLMGAIKATYKLKNNWLIQPNVSYKYAMDDYIYTRKQPSIYRNIHHNNALDASLNSVHYTTFGTIAFGLNYRLESINSTNLGKRQRDNMGLFASYQHAFFNQVDINAGLYINQNSVFGMDIYPGIDLGYQVNGNWRIYANVGMGQRLPTFTDLYYSGPNNIGNEYLRPEQVVTYELGTKYRAGNLHFNSSIFYKDGRDFIDWIRADTTQAWQVNNFTTLHTVGVHVDMNYQWQALQNLDALIYLGYTYLHPEIGAPVEEQKRNYLSQYAVNALQHQLVMRMGMHWDKKLFFNLQSRYQHRLNAHASNSDYKLGKYIILDARVAYTFSKFQVYADVNNILNVKYIESGVVPLPGAWFTVGLLFNSPFK